MNLILTYKVTLSQSSQNKKDHMSQKQNKTCPLEMKDCTCVVGSKKHDSKKFMKLAQEIQEQNKTVCAKNAPTQNSDVKWVEEFKSRFCHLEEDGKILIGSHKKKLIKDRLWGNEIYINDGYIFVEADLVIKFIQKTIDKAVKSERERFLEIIGENESEIIDGKSIGPNGNQEIRNQLRQELREKVRGL